MNRVELKEWAKQKIIGNKLNLFIGIGIVFGITILFSFGLELVQVIFGRASIITFAFALATDLFSVPLSIGLNAYMIGFVKNDIFDKDKIFGYFDNIFKIVGCMVLMFLIVMAGMIFFIIPGIYFAFSYVLVPYLLATQPDLSITETLELSRKMMDGHKFDFFVLGLSFFGWIILTPFTFGLLLIWLYPYMMTTTTKFVVDVMDSYDE